MKHLTQSLLGADKVMTLFIARIRGLTHTVEIYLSSFEEIQWCDMRTIHNPCRTLRSINNFEMSDKVLVSDMSNSIMSLMFTLQAPNLKGIELATLQITLN